MFPWDGGDQEDAWIHGLTYTCGVEGCVCVCMRKEVHRVLCVSNFTVDRILYDQRTLAINSDMKYKILNKSSGS